MDFKETSAEYADGNIETYSTYDTAEKTFTLFSNEAKWVRRIKAWKADRPDEVDILSESHGGIVAHLPKSWYRIGPPRRMSDEAKAAASERLRALHSKSKL